MIKTKNTYVDITGIVLDNEKYYLATYITKKQIVLFGKVIKEFTKTEEVPFIFSSFDIAKDFCELNPDIKEYTIKRTFEYGVFDVHYHTYKLVLNNRVYAYVVWSRTTLNQEFDKGIYFHSKTYPLVYSFIRNENDIEFPYNRDNYSLQPTFPKITHGEEKLSNIFHICEDDKHRFELIEK